MNLNKDVVVGDLTSDAPGSGARKNGGKPDYGLLPLALIHAVFGPLGYNPYHAPSARDSTWVLEELANWQRVGTRPCEREHLRCAMASSLGISPNTGDGWNLEMFREAVDVLTYGKGKYAPWNWAKGMPWSVPFACAIRHLIAISKGEDIDPESGCSHWGHVQANILMLLLFSERYPELNDMPFGVLKSPCGI